MSLKSKRVIIGLFCFVLVSGSLFFLPGEVGANNSLWDRMVGIDNLSSAFDANGQPDSPQVFAVNIIRIFLSFLGLIFLIVIIWGGFKWMTSGGSDEKVKQARAYIKNGIIGFVVIMVSYAFLTFVIDVIEGALEDQL